MLFTGLNQTFFGSLRAAVGVLNVSGPLPLSAHAADRPTKGPPTPTGSSQHNVEKFGFSVSVRSPRSVWKEVKCYKTPETPT